MRVPTITTYSSSTYRLGNLTRDLKDANEVISTQKRINEISDDPIGMSQVLSLKGSIDHLDQINSNVTMGKSWLESGENALDSVNSLILEAKTEVSRLVNASMSARERRDAIQMIDHTIDQLMTLGNTQINGNYIFSGTDTDTKPLSFSKDATEEKVLYNGNHTPFAVRTDRNSGVDVGRDGKETFWDSTVEINSTNNTIVFKEDNGHGITSEKVIEAVIPGGTYTTDKLENAVENALNEASAEKGYSAVYQVTYDENDKTFSIEEDGTYDGYLKTEFMWENGGEAYIDNVNAPFANDPEDVNVEVANRDALTISTPEPEGSEPFTLIWQGGNIWEVNNNPGYPILSPTISGTDRSVGIDLNESGTADINITLDKPVTAVGQAIEFDIVSAKGDHGTADEIGFSNGNAVYEPPSSDKQATYVTELTITNGTNDQIRFEEINTTGGSDIITADINTSGGDVTYTDMDMLSQHIETKMEARSGAVGNGIDYAVSYDPNESRFIIREDGTQLDGLNLLWSNTTGASTTAVTLGYYPQDDTISYPTSSKTAQGYITIDDTNNNLRFEEVDGGVSSTLLADVAKGTYTSMDDLGDAVADAMESASNASGNNADYDVTYNPATPGFEIQRTDGGGDLNLRFSSEDEPPSNTIAETLGFNPTSHTTGAPYTSDHSPVLMKFDSTNNRIDFREVRADGEYSEEISVAIPEGEYTDLDNVASQIETKMRNASPNNVDYDVSYDYTAGEFMIKGSDKNIKSFSMLWQTGSNWENSADKMLGFSGNNKVNFSTSDEPVVNITLDSSNNKIDFREITTDNAGNREVCELTAVVEENTYKSHEELALEVEKALEKASNDKGNRINYAVSWDEFTQSFTIKEKGTRLDEFHLDWKSGENAPLSVGGNGESIGGILGFDPEDDVAKAAESDRKAEWGIFNTLIDLKSYLADNDTYGIERSLGRLDAHYQNMTQRIVDSGMKYSRLETRETITSEVSLSLTERRSSIEDADMVESIMKLKNVQTAYQAALNSTSQIMNVSLVDYLR